MTNRWVSVDLSSTTCTLAARVHGPEAEYTATTNTRVWTRLISELNLKAHAETAASTSLTAEAAKSSGRMLNEREVRPKMSMQGKYGMSSTTSSSSKRAAPIAAPGPKVTSRMRLRALTTKQM